MNQILSKSILFIVLLTSTFLSCKKENEPIEDKDPFAGIYGDWKFMYRSYYDLETGQPTKDKEEVAGWGWANLTISEDGTGKNGVYYDFNWKIETNPNLLFIWDNYPYYKHFIVADTILILVPDTAATPHDFYNYIDGYELHRIKSL